MLLFGFGFGVVWMFVGKILIMVWCEVLLLGGLEVVVQFFVQSWWVEVGLLLGFQEGLKNVGMVMVLGGIFGGGLCGVVEILGVICWVFFCWDVEILMEDLELWLFECIVEEFVFYCDDL